MSLRPGRVLSIAIVSAWAWLFSSNLIRTYGARRTAEPLRFVGDTATDAGARMSQRGVYYRGARIGFIRERLIPNQTGYRAEQSGELVLNVLGRERQMEIEGAVETIASGELREFDFRLTTSSGRSPFETVVHGVVDNDELELTIRSARTERTERRPISEPIVLPINLYYSLAARGWSPGDSYRVQLFDPMTLAEGEAVIAVKDPEIVRWGGREEEAVRLQTTFAGLTTTAWVSEAGDVLKEETPLGWTLVREAPGTSLAPASGSANPDVTLHASIPAIGFAGDASTLSFAKLRLVDFPSGFERLEGGRQSRDGAVVSVSAETPRRTGSSLTPKEREKALEADAFIQTEDDAIIAVVRGIERGQPPEELASDITDWVYSSLTKSPTLSLPSAIEVLEQRVGDCNEHAVLFTALARAAGLPTRIATGLAYMGGQFYYHAWPEVWLERWVAADPTFGQFPADPLHVRLLTGGIETQYEILELLGRGAVIEVLETR